MINIYTDGSCLGNPGPGGWAVIINSDNAEVILKGNEKETTNNRMEMTAVLKALKWIQENQIPGAHIYSDSNLVVQTINKGWKRKANQDIWEKIDELISELKEIDIKWDWVKGHSINKFNQKADEVAVKEAEKLNNSKNLVRKSKNSGNGKGQYFCKNCQKEVDVDLSFMPDSGMIRADCSNCGTYVCFAEKNKDNLAKAKKNVLITKAQLEKVVEILKTQGDSPSENDIKKMKKWTSKQAEEFLDQNQTLF